MADLYLCQFGLAKESTTLLNMVIGQMAKNNTKSGGHISTTNLSQAAYHQIIDDLYENWETVPRGGVTINTKRIKPEGSGDYLIPAEEWEEKIIELNSNDEV